MLPMLRARALPFSYLAALTAAAALSLAACKSSKQVDDAGAGQPAASPSAESKKPAGGERGKRLPVPSDDRFDARIAEHLPRVPDPQIEIVDGAGAGAQLDNNAFRDRVVSFVRQVSAGPEKVTCDLPVPSVPSQRPFRTVVWIYQQGQQAGRGEATDAKLCTALKDATRRAVAAAGGEREALASARFAIDLPDHDYSLVEFQGKGAELSHGLVPVRVVDKALLQKRIDEGQAYLLRVIDREKKGVHKYYHANNDRFEPELHTIYTASTALTLLKLHARSGDKRLLDHANAAVDFMLSMQSHDERDGTAGGFFYSYDLERRQPERRLVAGTASKAIFTLLELHALTKEKKHLDAATSAANWLLTMQRPGGSVRPYMRQKDGGRWSTAKKESMLYTGQVLSALSRMYRATREQRYLDAASQTAGYLAGKVSMQGCYLGDEYRKPNPISSSWVILSLFDFVKASGDQRFEQIVFRCADELLQRQRRKPEDIYRHGRWQRSLSSSGNGWLAEVMSELYLYCREKNRQGCDRFKDAVVASFRLLLQHTYTPESSFVVKNPAAAAGGLFWSVSDRYVRTDSVCHGMNAYLNMIGHLGDGTLLEVPEPPLVERLSASAAAADAADDERDDGPAGSPKEPLMSSPEDPAEEGVERGGPGSKP